MSYSARATATRAEFTEEAATFKRMGEGAEKAEGPLAIHDMLLHGLSGHALRQLVDSLKVVDWDSLGRALGMSLRTYQRRKDAPEKALTQAQSERVWKMAEILAKANTTFGSPDNAERWLMKPAMGLDWRRPIDLLATRAGAEMVESFLGQLEYGVYV